MSVIPIDKSIAQRCAVLGLDFDKSNIGEDIKSTLNAAEEFADYQKDLTLNLGNSGTGMRLLTGYIAGFGKEWIELLSPLKIGEQILILEIRNSLR